MRAIRLGVVLPVFVLCALPVAADATFSGANGNGRIIYQTSALTSSGFPTTILSACPNGTGVKTIATGLFGSPSPDGTTFAYVKHNGTSHLGLWVKRMDGTSEEMIVPGSPSQPSWPTWSPDGKKLVFNAYVDQGMPQYVRQPAVADVATKVLTPLLSDASIIEESLAQNPVWSPGGTDIFFSGRPFAVSGQFDVYRVAAGGGTATRILGNDNELPSYNYMDMHPDGGTFTVTAQLNYPPDAIFETRRYDTGGGPIPGPYLGQVNSSTGAGDQAFSFSPDGTRIVFQRGPGQGIMTAELNGASPVAVGNLIGYYPRWSTNIDDCAGIGVANLKINEVGLGSAQFVELLGPIGDAGQAPFKLVVYDGAGARQGEQTISTALLQSHNASLPFLLSTPAANTAYGVTGHEALTVGLPNPGQACVTKGAGELQVNCVSWGCVANPVAPAGARFPAPGTGQTAQRQGLASTTFHLAAPTPKAANVAGATADPCPAPPAGGDPGPSAGGSKPGTSAGPKVTVKSGSVLTLKGNTVSVRLACQAGRPSCTGTAALTTGQAGTRAAKVTTLGSAKLKIAAGKAATVKITLKKAARKRVKKGKRLKAKLTVRLTGAPALTRSVSLTRR